MNELVRNRHEAMTEPRQQRSVLGQGFSLGSSRILATPGKALSRKAGQLLRSQGVAAGSRTTVDVEQFKNLADGARGVVTVLSSAEGSGPDAEQVESAILFKH